MSAEMERFLKAFGGHADGEGKQSVNYATLCLLALAADREIDALASRLATIEKRLGCRTEEGEATDPAASTDPKPAPAALSAEERNELVDDMAETFVASTAMYEDARASLRLIESRYELRRRA